MKLTTTTQPVTPPKPRTLPLAGSPLPIDTQPVGAPVPALPAAPSAPAAPTPAAPIPAPTTPPPLTTSDPLAFATGSSGNGNTPPATTDPFAPILPGADATGSGAHPLAQANGGPAPAWSTAPSYTGGYTYAYQDLFPQLDFSKFANTPATFGDLVNRGDLTAAQVAQAFGVDPNGDLSGLLKTAVGAFSPNDNAAFQAAQNQFAASAAPPAAPSGPARYLVGGQEVGADGQPIPGGYNALSELYRQLGTTPGAVNPQVESLLAANPNLASGLDPAAQQSIAGILGTLGAGATRNLSPGPANDAGTTRSIAPGAANDAGTPSAPLPGTGLTLAGAPGASGATPGASGSPGATPGSTPGAPQSVAPGVSGYQTTPDNALTNLTLLPSNNIDRVKLAQDALDSTITNVLDPQFQANMRDENRYNFGAGRGVSGVARTSQGNILSDYQRTKANLSNTLLNNATTGSIDDLYRNLGMALQEQQFQAGQQSTAFNQNLGLQGLADSEQTQAFDRALQQIIQGYSGNPADVSLILSQIFGGQAGQAGQAASNYAASNQNAANASAQNQAFKDWLASMLMGGIARGINNLPGAGVTPSSGYPGYGN